MKKPKKVMLMIVSSILILAGLIFCGIITYVVGLGTFTGLYTGIKERNATIHWREKTKPIDEQVITDLCTKFDISKEEHVCKPGEVVYGPEFYPYIVKHFCPSMNECLTVDDVEEMIGKYRYSEAAQNSLMPDESNRYRYDFQTDHMYPLVIAFYKDGEIKRIQYNFGN